jgi:hypothetical protein
MKNGEMPTISGRVMYESSERLPPNAPEFSCGDSFHYSTKLLCRAASYNSSLGSASKDLNGDG